MTDEKTTDEVEKFETNWHELRSLAIEVSNRNGFDFFEARGDVLAFSRIKPDGDGWEVVDEDMDERIKWRRREVTSMKDWLARR
jgi:hypothetical protein